MNKSIIRVLRLYTFLSPLLHGFSTFLSLYPHGDEDREVQYHAVQLIFSLRPFGDPLQHSGPYRSLLARIEHSYYVV